METVHIFVDLEKDMVTSHTRPIGLSYLVHSSVGRDLYFLLCWLSISTNVGMTTWTSKWFIFLIFISKMAGWIYAPTHASEIIIIFFVAHVLHVYFTCIHVKYTCYTPGNGLVVFATPKNPHFDPSLTSE